MSKDYNDFRDLALVRVAVAEGKTPDDIARYYEWPVRKAEHLIARLRADEEHLDHLERHVVGRRAEQVYTDYLDSTKKNISTLDEVIVDLRAAGREGMAVVTAIKVKQDMLDRGIKLGQDLGFIPKRADVRVHVLARLGDRELREHVAEQYRMLDGAMHRFGSGHFLDVTAEEVPLAREGARALPQAVSSARLREGITRRKAYQSGSRGGSLQ